MNRRTFLGWSSLSVAAMAGSGLLSLNACKKDDKTISGSYDAIVIGSGFGGSVAALRLAEKGVRTLLLEMGMFYDVSKGSDIFSPNLPADKRSTWLKGGTELPFGPNVNWGQKYTGVLDRVEFNNMNVYRNVCLGGGSISSGGVLIEPDAAFFGRFVNNEISFEELSSTYFPKVKRELAAQKMPDDLFNSPHYKFAQVCKAHAQKAGFDILHADSFYDFDVWRKEAEGFIQKSALNGELLYGNNNGIKKSLDRNYLSRALATEQLDISTLSKVKDIYMNADGSYNIVFEKLSTNGTVTETNEVSAKKIFFGAGSIGSTELLLKARETGALQDLPSEIGQYWGTNGNVFAIREQIDMPTGNMHSSPPTLCVLNWDNPVTPITAMQDIFPLGIDLRMLLMVGQAYNEKNGTLFWDKSTEAMQLDWSPGSLDASVQAMTGLIERMNAANGSVLNTSFIKKGYSDDFTYHPLGGCALGKATDLKGRVKGYKNMYVLDGSLLPGNCAMVNPSLTIAALAERNMDYILKEDF